MNFKFVFYGTKPSPAQDDPDEVRLWDTTGNQWSRTLLPDGTLQRYSPHVIAVFPDGREQLVGALLVRTNAVAQPQGDAR